MTEEEYIKQIKNLSFEYKIMIIKSFKNCNDAVNYSRIQAAILHIIETRYCDDKKIKTPPHPWKTNPATLCDPLRHN
jgi:hypothetical protein